MAKLITDGARKAIKKMAQISQCVRVLELMPTPEDFAMRLVGDLRHIANTINNVSTRMNEMLDKYSSIPTDFLLKGFDEVLKKLDDVSDYAKFTINETLDMAADTVRSAREITRAAGDTASIVTSTVIQVGGALTYGVGALWDAGVTAEFNSGDYEKNRVSIPEDVVQDVVDGKITVDQMKDEMERRASTKWQEGLSDYRDKLGRASEVAINGNNEYYGIDEAMGKAVEGINTAINAIDNAKNTATEWVDGEHSIGYLKEKVENAKVEVEEKIQQVKNAFEVLTKNFDEGFGWIIGKNAIEDDFRNASNTAYEMEITDYGAPAAYDENGNIISYEKKKSEVFDAFGDATGAVADFIKNFNIGKVVTGIGGMVVAAGAATLAMDLLPSIDIDGMLREVMSGVDRHRVDKMTELYYNKYDEDGPDLFQVPDVPWRLSKDDLLSLKYNADKYEKFLTKCENSKSKKKGKELSKRKEKKLNRLKAKSEKEERLKDNFNLYSAVSKIEGTIASGMANINEQLSKSKITNKDAREQLKALCKENKDLMEANSSALDGIRKLRRNVIKAKQIEKFKGFMHMELEYLKNDLRSLGYTLKREWDVMMSQYKNAIKEIEKFFSFEGNGGSEAVDRCCDRINDDATQIVDLCKGIAVQITSSVAKVPTPYAIGTCVDMPVHKVLSFFNDLKIIITFIKNLIQLGIDIISQLSILAKLIFNGLQNLADLLKKLKELIGVDKILNAIDFLVALFKPKMADAKLLLENSLSPVYYNETDEYEQRLDDLEGLLKDNQAEGNVDMFYYSNDKLNHGKDYGGKVMHDEEIDEVIAALEEKGNREIVAYRSPILNDTGDDFVGWRFFHAYAYDYMDAGWLPKKKIRKNRLISKASKKNKLRHGKLVGGVARLRKSIAFGEYRDKDGSKKFYKNTVSGFDAYYWYTKWTTDPTDCTPDMSNGYTYKEGELVFNPENVNKNVVNPVQTTQNGSLVELSDGRMVFVKDKIVKSGDIINVDGIKCRVN